MSDEVRDTEATEALEIDADSGADESATAESDEALSEESDEAPSEDDSPAPRRFWRRDLWRVQVNVKPVAVILILLVLISGGVTAWLYVKQYKPDQQTDPSVARAAVNAASDGTVALLSYSPDTLDKDFATAKSHLSGDFLSYYDQFTQQIVAPAAKQKSLKTTAHVMRAAISELHPHSAVVLVFVDQSTTSKDNPNPTMAASSVLVHMALVDGKWLITKFTPV
ncbi:hypothetical protein [Mycobacterium riyadhense]|uniref:Twin-arginine translocation pathway signal n=1 Tax=Mycobacterium riyadhense TaxID=486698 RepID=A0A1X2CDW4_9MYCO|nr:hypothetical protein [Mycobacterium riyadhense]MCV7144603.1 hypothetical protein [Mycobacterium riyadhense]ORW74147.1 hypothetical protein AWC22_23825 [Mycobacterium riyadhense]VTP00351.1 hypothetical protein BIN_B_03461 [Mycobacterium riyadhense]